MVGQIQSPVGRDPGWSPEPPFGFVQDSWGGETTLGISGDELRAAWEVQTRLLRRQPPRLRTLEWGGCYSPARGVGGDFYDFAELGPGRVGVTVGDVSGKGISAALMMASLHSCLHTCCLDGVRDICSILRVANREFYECSAPNHFATVFFGDYQDATRTLNYVNCGHVPPVLARATGETQRLQPTATVLGLFAAWDCQAASVVLEPGDLLLILSDGVSEARGEDDEEFGDRRFSEALRRLQHLPVARLVRALLAAVRQFGGRGWWDDITVVAARGIVLGDDSCC